MRLEKSYYSKQCIGPGGRHCSCCAPIPKVLKKIEHRKARQALRLEAKKLIKCDEVQVDRI